MFCDKTCKGNQRALTYWSNSVRIIIISGYFIHKYSITRLYHQKYDVSIVLYKLPIKCIPETLTFM